MVEQGKDQNEQIAQEIADEAGKKQDEIPGPGKTFRQQLEERLKDLQANIARVVKGSESPYVSDLWMSVGAMSSLMEVMLEDNNNLQRDGIARARKLALMNAEMATIQRHVGELETALQEDGRLMLYFVGMVGGNWGAIARVLEKQADKEIGKMADMKQVSKFPISRSEVIPPGVEKRKGIRPVDAGKPNRQANRGGGQGKGSSS